MTVSPTGEFWRFTCNRTVCFCHCCEQCTHWMTEKMQTATDESYREATNLEAKLKKHEAFEAELSSNKASIDATITVSAVYWLQSPHMLGNEYLNLKTIIFRSCANWVTLFRLPRFQPLHLRCKVQGWRRLALDVHNCGNCAGTSVSRRLHTVLHGRLQFLDLIWKCLFLLCGIAMF